MGDGPRSWRDRRYTERTNTCFDVLTGMLNFSSGQVTGWLSLLRRSHSYGAPMPCTGGSSNLFKIVQILCSIVVVAVPETINTILHCIEFEAR